MAEGRKKYARMSHAALVGPVTFVASASSIEYIFKALPNNKSVHRKDGNVFLIKKIDRSAAISKRKNEEMF